MNPFELSVKILPGFGMEARRNLLKQDVVSWSSLLFVG